MDIAADLVRTELARLLAADEFRRSPGHMRLLQHVVERRLEGDLRSLSETAIGLDVFRRDPSTFNPRADPIVRVTAMRLRERLNAHYGRLPRPPAVRIVLPSGRYVPEFVQETTRAERAGVAVLPVDNRTGRRELDAFCDAIPEQLGGRFGQIRGMRVLARQSAEEANRRQAGGIPLAQILDVAWVVEVSVSIAASGQIALRIVLRNLRQDSEAWSARREIPETGRFAALDELTDLASRFLTETENAAEAPARTARSAVAPREPPRLDDREAVALANMLHRTNEVANLDRAIALLRNRLAQSPESAATRGLLSWIQYRRLSAMDRPFPERVASIQADATRALEIDPAEPWAQQSLAGYRFFIDGQLDAGTADILKVIERYPAQTSARTLATSFLMYQGRFEEAVEQSRMMMDLDPLSVLGRIVYANTHAYMRDGDTARAQLEIVLAFNPHDMWANIFYTNNECWNGDPAVAERTARVSTEMFPDNPAGGMQLAMAYGRQGDRAAAERTLAETLARHAGGYVSHYQRAMVAGAMGDLDTAAHELRRSKETLEVLWASAGVDPTFHRYSRDPAFVALLRELGLPGWRGRDPG